MKTFKISTLLPVVLLIAASCGSAGTQQEQAAGEVPMEHGGEQPVTQNIIPGNNAEAPVLELQDDTYNFGEVKEGAQVEHEFRFTNTGGSPLIISNVQASCGCTSPEYSKNPILPGEEGMVKVVFNSNGQVGQQHKIVTVSSNALSANTLLHLRGEVKK